MQHDPIYKVTTSNGGQEQAITKLDVFMMHLRLNLTPSTYGGCYKAHQRNNMYQRASKTAAVIFMFTIFKAEARAQSEAQAPIEAEAQPAVDQVQNKEKTETMPAPSPFTFGGYAEALYQWNFNTPSNGITNFRGFDNRHNSFTLSNIALDAKWDDENLVGRLTLQVGHTPSTYYLGEPSLPGASGANASGTELWKYLQQAYVGYHFEPFTVSAGLFLSPIGPESMAVKDNWNWSRSNLFFGLPFYHTGIRLMYDISNEWAVTLAGYNGWNSVLDNNDDKSVSLQLTYTKPDLALSVLYFGGIERNKGVAEGQGFRHLLDAHLTWNAMSWLSFLFHANVGVEPTNFGVSHWVAGALYARVQLHKQLYFALRGDAFYEHAAENSSGQAAPIFWPSPWVSSGTATVDYRPHEHVSFRLEYRHDHAERDMYFAGSVMEDEMSMLALPNRSLQDTLSLGVTAWF